MTINALFKGEEGYAGLGLVLIILFWWIAVVLPVYCIGYNHKIVKERHGFWYSFYNSLVIIIAHLLPFNLRGETEFIVWVLFWNAVSYIGFWFKHRQKDNNNEKVSDDREV